jgi:hypothetical protein
MNRYRLLVAAIGTTLLAGCATPDRQAAAQDDEKEYVTGSRIPVKSGTGRDVKNTSSKEGINDMLRRGGNATGGVTGAGGG